MLLQAEAKKLVMAGALTDPVDGALFIFKDLSKEVRNEMNYIVKNDDQDHA